jgi:hypothetical protein
MGVKGKRFEELLHGHNHLAQFLDPGDKVKPLQALQERKSCTPIQGIKNIFELLLRVENRG